MFDSLAYDFPPFIRFKITLPLSNCMNDAATPNI